MPGCDFSAGLAIKQPEVVKNKNKKKDKSMKGFNS